MATATRTGAGAGIPFSLEGKAALVAGVPGPLLTSITRQLDQSGARTALATLPAPKASVADAETFAASAADAVFRCEANLLEEPAVIETLERIKIHLGGIDILVTHAGALVPVSLAKESEVQFLDVMRANVWLPLRLAQLCRPSMIARGGGVVVHIGSNAAERPIAGAGTHNLASASLVALSKVMALAAASEHIRVVSLSIGALGPMSGPGVSAASYVSRPNPLVGPGAPADVASMVLALVSDAGRFVTASDYVVDGGELAL